MSRSYKHKPVCGRVDKFFKDYANRRVRRKKMDLELSKSGYKKICCSWDIREDFYYRTWEEYWEHEWKFYYWCLSTPWFRSPDKEPNYKESYRDWWRAYKMK